MLKTYLTTIPLQGRFDLQAQKYKGSGEALLETPFPVLQVIKDTLKPTDTVRVVAVRLGNADTDRNLNLFYEEAEKHLGITKEMVTEVAPMQEAQNSRTLARLCRDVVEALPDKTGLYVDITYGTKTIPVLLFSAITCAEKVRRELEVYGIYYGDLHRNDGKVTGAFLADVSVLYNLSGALAACESGENATDVFRLLTKLAERED